ncbi:MAG: DUF882 domain-containing protein [Gammaproteobacteria bacterium SHHR-1]|uniref:YcbK family protein n=1 Tax=Magnetovirga frankeli TaxID=947516 RepID=UPI003282082A
MSEYKQDSDNDGLIITPSRRLFLGAAVAGSTLGLSGCSLIDILSGDFFSSWKDEAKSKREQIVQGKAPSSKRPSSTRNRSAMPLQRYDARYLAFHNTHTGEKLKVTYWEDGKYLNDALAEVNHHLRDHRSNEVTQIDKGLLDQLFVLRKKLDTNRPFQIISGYRSPKTNALLRRQGRGVARRSLHMYGRAIDIRVPGHSLSQVRLAALSMHSGGVGYYPGPQFVHLDTGRVRRW